MTDPTHPSETANDTVVDGRYRIFERLGSGGMADVYRAQDTHLGREVALKVLHRRFAQDQEFVERFRREASAAAGLQHPNVVGVFDRGEHEGTYYIAMEYLPGRTLKEVVGTEAPLSQELTIDLGLQILAAAGFAHRHGVIHRDFKPHNVIIDEAWRAKVTDFGIARAGASEMTETGSIMGTAQYLSPEQAQGHAVNAASDLYSIGVVLYELLAGRLPFEGDSAVSVALKHLSEPPPPLSQLRPDVDPTLESVIMAALAKDPAQRWQSADEFAAGLEAARSQIESGGSIGQETAAWAPLPAPVLAPAEDPAMPATVADERHRPWPLVTLALLVLALVGVLAYLALSGLLAGERVRVPGVEGQQLVQARAALEKAGLEVRETRVQSQNRIDTVIDQDPNPGRDAEKGSVVTLEVSKGPGTVNVPSVEGLPQERAAKELTKAGLKFNLDRQPSETVREGLAIRTVPREGELVQRGTRLRLFVSSGREQATVPDVTGLSQGSAEARLENEGLEVAITEEEADEPEGEILSQDPTAGTRVDNGTRVTLTVSTGKQKLNVPNVMGLMAGDASRQLRADGLGVVTRRRTVTDPQNNGVVVDQRPGAGTEVEKGRTVVIIVGRLDPVPDDQVAPAPP